MTVGWLHQMAAEATPGPWAVREELGSGWWDVVLPDRTYAAMSVSEADAALIALTPELARWAADAADAIWRLNSGNLWNVGDHADFDALLARLAALNPQDKQT